MKFDRESFRGNFGLILVAFAIVAGLGTWSVLLTIGYAWGTYGCTNGWLLHVAAGFGVLFTALATGAGALVWREAIGRGDDSRSEDDLSPEDDRIRFLASQGFYVGLLGLYSVILSEIAIIMLGCE